MSVFVWARSARRLAWSRNHHNICQNIIAVEKTNRTRKNSCHTDQWPRCRYCCFDEVLKASHRLMDIWHPIRCTASERAVNQSHHNEPMFFFFCFISFIFLWKSFPTFADMSLQRWTCGRSARGSWSKTSVARIHVVYKLNVSDR